jgi:hypothetical protein
MDKAGLLIALGFIMPIVVEYWPAFDKWPKKYKYLAFLAFFTLAGFSAWLIAPSLQCSRPDAWHVIRSIALAYMASQATKTSMTFVLNGRRPSWPARHKES